MREIIKSKLARKYKKIIYIKIIKSVLMGGSIVSGRAMN
jgi:hypothetical protein